MSNKILMLFWFLEFRSFFSYREILSSDLKVNIIENCIMNRFIYQNVDVQETYLIPTFKTGFYF
jgi:hypothetical protein